MSNDMKITFYGVRGSLASPNVDTIGVGGNTSCVEVIAGDERIVLDAGTGLRALGDKVMTRGPSTTTFLLSHLHWDHIQGLPFFTPIYVPGHKVNIRSGPNGILPLKAAITRQMAPPFFPVHIDDVASQVWVQEFRNSECFHLGDLKVTTQRLNHPDPVYGYRLDFAGRSVVYATDTEHYSCVDSALLRLSEGADLLIYDAQYTPEEYSGCCGPAKQGWGHSTYEAAAELANAAGVGELLLFHHDPRRSDEGVADIEARCRKLFANTRAAREGMCITLSANKNEEIDDTWRSAV